MKKQTEPVTDILDVSVNQTSDKAIVVSSFKDIVSSVMSEAQFSILSGRTPKHLIKHRPGKGGKVFSYVPHGYVTAKLNQAFGFDWNFEVLPNGKGDYFSVMDEMATPNRNGGTSITNKAIIVMGRLTVRIRNPKNMIEVIATISKDSTGEKEFVPGMSWGGLIKSAESDAFKKAASRLGIALDLYWQDTDSDYEEQEDDLRKKAKALESEGKSKPDIGKELGLSIVQVQKLLNGGGA